MLFVIKCMFTEINLKCKKWDIEIIIGNIKWWLARGFEVYLFVYNAWPYCLFIRRMTHYYSHKASTLSFVLQNSCQQIMPQIAPWVVLSRIVSHAWSAMSNSSSEWGCKNKKLTNHNQLFFLNSTVISQFLIRTYSLTHYCYGSL